MDGGGCGLAGSSTGHDHRGGGRAKSRSESRPRPVRGHRHTTRGGTACRAQRPRGPRAHSGWRERGDGPEEALRPYRGSWGRARPDADPRKRGVGGPREGKASAARRRRRRRRRRRPAEQEQQRSPCRKEQRRGGAGNTPGSSWAAGRPGAGRPGLWASSLAGAPGGDRGRAPFFSMRREPGAVRSAGLAARSGGS